MNLDYISLATTPIYLKEGSEHKSVGTGFFVAKKFGEEAGMLFLVTNHHVLTGHGPTEDKEPIGDNITFILHQNRDNPSEITPITIPLFNDNGEKLWLDYENNPKADIAAYPLVFDIYENHEINGFSEDDAKTDMFVRPATNVSVVGYPYSFHDEKNQLPVWKTGTVASEPELDFQGDPCFLVDVSAFPGMSGSPVFAISHGMHETEDGNVAVGEGRKFLGIYASQEVMKHKKFLEELAMKDDSKREGIQYEENLQLGYIWKAEVLFKGLENYDPKEVKNKFSNLSLEFDS